MFTCSRYETGVIMSGAADGVVRQYDPSVGCPHKPGGEIVMTSAYLDNTGRAIPFAKVEVVSVRPGNLSDFRIDPAIANMDGFPSSAMWEDHLNVMYPGISTSDALFHIRFRVKELDKQAGQRGNETPEREYSEVDDSEAFEG